MAQMSTASWLAPWTSPNQSLLCKRLGLAALRLKGSWHPREFCSGSPLPKFCAASVTEACGNAKPRCRDLKLEPLKPGQDGHCSERQGQLGSGPGEAGSDDDEFSGILLPATG